VDESTYSIQQKIMISQRNATMNLIALLRITTMLVGSAMATEDDSTCGMQTSGTLIIDGRRYRSSEDRSTSLAIVRNKRRRLLPRQRRVKQFSSYFTDENITPSSSPSELPSNAPSNAPSEFINEFIDSWSNEFGFDGSDFSLLSDSNGEELMKTADVLFIQGDRQSSLLERYKYTQLNEEMWKLLERGGLIAGVSVGAIAMGDFMPILSENQLYQHGFNFLPGVALDIRIDDQWDGIYGILKKNPSVLGIGISEKTAIVVQKNYFQVVETDRADWSSDDGSDGKSFDPDAIVAVYSCTNENDCNEEKSPYLKLKHRQWYDLCQRKIVTEKEVRQNLHASDEEVVHPFQTPYSFKSDYRLASQDFRCSGRPCTWLSSRIKIPDKHETTVEVSESVSYILTQLTELNILISIESVGDMEEDDFLSISYRTASENNAFEDEWTELQRMNGTIGQVYKVYDIPVFAGITIQIKLDAETSHENNEWYIVRDLQLEITKTPSPSSTPSIMPSAYPTASPSLNPSEVPTLAVSSSPTLLPSQKESSSPSSGPTINFDFLDDMDWTIRSPSLSPSFSLSKEPSTTPSFSLSEELSTTPSKIPMKYVSNIPSTVPKLENSSNSTSEIAIKHASSSPSITPALTKTYYPTTALKTQNPTSQDVTDKTVTSIESSLIMEDGKEREGQIELTVPIVLVVIIIILSILLYVSRRKNRVGIDIEAIIKDLKDGESDLESGDKSNDKDLDRSINLGDELTNIGDESTSIAGHLKPFLTLSENKSDVSGDESILDKNQDGAVTYPPSLDLSPPNSSLWYRTFAPPASCYSNACVMDKNAMKCGIGLNTIDESRNGGSDLSVSSTSNSEPFSENDNSELRDLDLDNLDDDGVDDADDDGSSLLDTVDSQDETDIGDDDETATFCTYESMNREIIEVRSFKKNEDLDNFSVDDDNKKHQNAMREKESIEPETLPSGAKKSFFSAGRVGNEHTDDEDSVNFKFLRYMSFKGL